MIPTNQLRFIEREVPAPEFGENIAKTVRVLQQKWVSPYAGAPDEWRDVPLENEHTREERIQQLQAEIAAHLAEDGPGVKHG